MTRPVAKPIDVKAVQQAMAKNPKLCEPIEVYVQRLRAMGQGRAERLRGRA